MPRISTLTLQVGTALKKDDAGIAKFFKKNAVHFVTMLDELETLRATGGDDGMIVQTLALALHGMIGSLGESQLQRAVLAEFFEEHLIPSVRETNGPAMCERLIAGLIEDLGKCRLGSNGAPS